MSLKKRLLNYVQAQLAKDKVEGDVELGSGASDDMFDENKGRTNMKLLEFFMYKDPITFSGLALKSTSIWGKGMDVMSDNAEAEQICKDIIALPNFKEYMVTEFFQTCGYGDAYLENIWDEEKMNIVGFAITDPKTIFPKWDKKGYIEMYVQKIKGTKKNELNPEQITHFKFFQIADNVRGIGLVEPLTGTIEAMMIARNATKDLLFRHGVPFAHFKKIGASVKDIPKMGKVAKDITNKKSFASSEKYSFDFHGVKNALDIQPHIDLLEDTYASGLGIIKPYLFRAGEKTNRAALDKLGEFQLLETQMYQEKVSSIIENQIFKPVMEAHKIMENGKPVIPQVVWEPLTEMEEEKQLKNDKEFIKLTDDAKTLGYLDEAEARNLIRERLGMQEKDDESDGTEAEETVDESQD